MAKEAVLLKNEGFKGMKVTAAGLGIDTDLINIKAVRQAIGPEPEIMIDTHYAYNLKESFELCEGLKEFNIAWIEEPVSPELYDHYAQIRSTSRIQA